MSDTIEHIVIVGGGSAGWLVAGVLAAEHRLRVTLIESPGVPAIGVGEGDWPSMRDTLHRMGAAEPAFIRARRPLFPPLFPARGLVRREPGGRMAGRAPRRFLRRPGQLPAAPVRAHSKNQIETPCPIMHC
jgi:glycine/D-amino acid oxidase-like deaminating enzyme